MSAVGVFWLVVGVAIVGWLGVAIFKAARESRDMSREELEAAAAEYERRRVRDKAAKARAKAPISVVGERTAAGLACPKCGGTSFKARRSKAARTGITATSLATGVGGLAAAAATKRRKVQCVTCGTIYNRG